MLQAGRRRNLCWISGDGYRSSSQSFRFSDIWCCVTEWFFSNDSSHAIKYCFNVLSCKNRSQIKRRENRKPSRYYCLQNYISPSYKLGPSSVATEDPFSDSKQPDHKSHLLPSRADAKNFWSSTLCSSVQRFLPISTTSKCRPENFFLKHPKLSTISYWMWQRKTTMAQYAKESLKIPVENGTKMYVMC
jgi:hypothetical protein